MSERRTSASISRSVVIALEDETVGCAFARILESRSHVVMATDDPIEALEGMPSDVLVAEFGSEAARDAGLDGLELIETARVMGHDPVSVLVAGDPDEDERRRAAEIGVDFIIERPLLPDSLVEAVESAGSPQPEEDHTLHLRLCADAFAGEIAARELLGWCLRCEITPAARARIGTAVAEVVQNASDHGARELELAATMGTRELVVEIVDDGPGFDTVEALTETSLDSTTGLGRAFALAEHIEFHSTPDEGSCARLVFRVATAAFDDEHRIDLSDLDFFVPATSKELLATLQEDPDAPIILSPALAVVLGRILMGPDPERVLEGALRA